MALTLHIEIDTTRPPDIGARKWSDFSKVAMQAAADLWHEKFIWTHFQPSSRYTYRYSRRAPDTIKRKKQRAIKGQVKKGGSVDLVWTGTLERQMLRRGILRIFPTRFVLSKPAGSYITDKPRGSRPNMVREITTTVPREQEAMARAYQSAAAKLMNTYRATRRKKI